MKMLPTEVNQLIREYATDKLQPSATALLIKDLEFDYLPVVDNPVYWPRRLQIRIVNHDPFVRFLNINDDFLQLGNRRQRQFMIHNFIPSYWSDYADTYDGDVYDDPELLQRLQND